MRYRYIHPVLAVVVLIGSLLTNAAASSTAAPGSDRTEEEVTVGGAAPEVRESVVRVKVPLPESAGPRPAACDWLSYLRYRDVNGPKNSQDADKILLAQPGVLEGASAFDTVARNTVARAAEQGQHVEFWALDRRSNCLEDHRGVDAAVVSGDADIAVGYYYRGESIAGHRFGGFRSGAELNWLSTMGIRRTVEDQYALMAAELPDQRTRRDKVLCGGHSLGGAITAYFAQWDFNGNPGYEQCSGYFALDSAISTTLPFAPDWLPSEMTGQTPAGSAGIDAVRAGIQAGLVPASANLPALINPETMNLLAIAGAAARTAPAAESPLLRIENFNIDASIRILFSKDLGEALQPGVVPIRDIRLSNTAALGSLLDNNSQPLAFLQTAVGFYNGGPVTDKDFPVPNVVNQHARFLTSAMLGPDRFALPTAAGPLYGWDNYNALPAELPRSRDGLPFTSPDKEVTDIGQLASNLADHPLDFTEQYFPIMLIADTMLGPAHLQEYLKHPEGLTARPTLALLGGAGLTGEKQRTAGTAGTVTTVVAPGYHHLDVLTASAKQNGNRDEPISAALTDFARNNIA